MTAAKELNGIQQLIQQACHHARNHHAKSHEGCAERVMSRFPRAFREIYQIEHERREAESISELLNDKRSINKTTEK